MLLNKSMNPDFLKVLINNLCLIKRFSLETSEFSILSKPYRKMYI